MGDGALNASARFVQRLEALRTQLDALQQELEPQASVKLAVRCRRLVRDINTLVSTNITVLFPDETAEVRQDLHNWLDYAEQQTEAALSTEYDQAAVLGRLGMAVSLVGVVLEAVEGAMQDLRRRQVL